MGISALTETAFHGRLPRRANPRGAVTTLTPAEQPAPGGIRFRPFRWRRSCGADGAFEDGGAISFSFTFCYDETPDGDFSDLDTLCGDEEGVRPFGGDVTVAPFVGGEDNISRGARAVPTRTVVDRSVAVSSSDGRTMTFPSPEGTEWRILTRYDEPTVLIEI